MNVLYNNVAQYNNQTFSDVLIKPLLPTDFNFKTEELNEGPSWNVEKLFLYFLNDKTDIFKHM